MSDAEDLSRGMDKNRPDPRADEVNGGFPLSLVCFRCKIKLNGIEVREVLFSKLEILVCMQICLCK